ncbi:hypothetical protein B0A48_14208 [Cryoendolithus antarcticus]|uniref:Uncharacterized protein n=1 Tax=Cryoendolithus antarcticus TaxID=1507870 RepID=A0A1V8SLG5_9PEZI|nr:hypothetical protein B0A48_14208 [Cryoendolithus antarcticus]
MFNNKVRINCNSNNINDVMAGQLIPYTGGGMISSYPRYAPFPGLLTAMSPQAPIMMPQPQMMMPSYQYQAPMMMPQTMPYPNFAPYSNYQPSSNYNPASNFAPVSNNNQVFSPNNNQNWNYNGGNSSNQCSHQPVNVFITPPSPPEYPWRPPAPVRRRGGPREIWVPDNDDYMYPTPYPYDTTGWPNTWNPSTSVNPWSGGYSSGSYLHPILGWIP